MAEFGVPPWLLAGLALGAVAAVAITAIFLAGERLLPGGNRAGSDGRRTGRKRSEEIRREEIGDYLAGIGESYETDADVEGHEVAFFLPDRAVAVTFDPRAYLSLEDSSVEAILVEHEMPGAHIGRRLPFETPEAEPRTGDAEQRRATGRTFPTEPGGSTPPEEVETSFAILGLPPGASREAVKRAYRDRVKEVHPDHGGDEQSFKRVQEAYATAREHAD